MTKTSTAARAEGLQREVAEQLLERARTEGVSLVGPGGLLSGVTKTVLETALDAEMSEHLGYEPHERVGADNNRNGYRAKTVLTDVGPVEVSVPRDRAGSFEPRLVRKRQRRLTGVDDLVISLVAKGLTTGEVAAHLAEVYGAEVSRETISKITDRVLEGLVEWANRPLDRVYPVVFIDAIVVKIRDGQVANRPIYVVVGVTVDGERDILGLWAGSGGEGAKYWHQVLTEVRNRGVEDVCILVCDGLTGLPDAVTAIWPQTVVQTCVIHLLRNSFRYASKKDWPALAKDLKPVYTAPTCRTRPPGSIPATSTPAPRDTVSGLAPTVVATSFCPPRPIARASAPSSSRHCCSFRCGLISVSLRPPCQGDMRQRITRNSL